MEIKAIASKVMNLLINKQVQEIAVWQSDTTVLLLDGTVENYEWGCSDKSQMPALAEMLDVVKEAGYKVWFSGYGVSWERVHIYLSKESEVAKMQKYTEVKNPPYHHHECARIGRMYFHR